MSTANSEIMALKRKWPDAELVGEGKHQFALLPTLKVNADGHIKVVSALIQAWPSEGYTTRVYFSERFTSKGNNWNVFNILGKTWHARSWNDVPADLPWMEILSCHLHDLQ